VTFEADDIGLVQFGGASRWYRANGSVEMSIFVPLRVGDGPALEAADLILRSFDEPAGGVRFTNARIIASGAAGDRWRVDLGVDWWALDVTGLYA
jgi:hypothetical protein